MGSNFLTSIQVGCLAAPEWVLTNNTSNGFKNQTKLQGGVRGSDQQADQHGVLRQLRVHVHVHLLRQGRRGLQGLGGFLQEVLRTREEARSSSKILLNPAPWNGDPLSMPLKQLLNWRRPSIKVFLTCTRHLMAMLTFATSLKENSLANKLTRSRRFPYGLPR